MTTIPEQVRRIAEKVASSSQHVKINREKISGYGAMLLGGKPIIRNMDAENAFDADIHFVDRNDPVRTASYFLMLDTINFGSGYFKDLQKIGIDFEYAYFAKKLKLAFLSGHMNAPVKWALASTADMHEIFAVPKGLSTHADNLMRDFAACLQITGRHMMQEYGGDVGKLLDAAGNSAIALVDIVGAWESFKGGFDYNGESVFLFKRAQILAADLSLALGIFDDTAELTAFADNMIPHVLHHDGILEYAPFLERKIKKHELIPAGSMEEIEMLCCAVHAVELIRKDLERQGAGHVSAMNVDHLLWHRGYQADIYQFPAHQTKSIWY